VYVVRRAWSVRMGGSLLQKKFNLFKRKKMGETQLGGNLELGVGG